MAALPGSNFGGFSSTLGVAESIKKQNLCPQNSVSNTFWLQNGVEIFFEVLLFQKALPSWTKFSIEKCFPVHPAFQVESGFATYLDLVS